MSNAREISLESIAPDCVVYGISGLTQTWNNGDGWSFIGNPRPDHGLMLITCEKAEVRECGQDHLIALHGDLLYIPQNSEYEIRFFGQSVGISDIQINFKMQKIGGEALCFADKVTRWIIDAPQQIFEDMSKIADTSLNQKKPTLRVTKMLYGLLESILVYKQLYSDQTQKSSVTPALLYIDSHIGDRIRVTDLAKMCLMSETSFRKAFREQTGLSPSQYKIRSKIEKACILLQTPEISITEIAETVGFCDVAEFYKFFIAIVGKTPRRYRDDLTQ